MYMICVYDVNEKRCVKIMKILRCYMFHVQKSVFEGELTPKKYKELRNKIDAVIKDGDKVLFYFTYENKKFHKESLGEEVDKLNIII
ncbi:CRISPR-associated protein, Cas2 family [Kandleria vitulina]|uniref:CRISPR-associated endoribonuclease Cas2 n=1 Tax=Kandleria vitulina TaxID=1630 RepID=A0A1H2PXL0_9FIRM|nr:CRISPR-associated endonuclease Cas2 [Kandleria vitulina]SDV99224.1 CRISPR-associated protein, Cas2 family [Kandleria vitulina]